MQPHGAPRAIAAASQRITGAIARLAGRLFSFGNTPPRPATERALAVARPCPATTLADAYAEWMRANDLPGCGARPG